MEQNYETYELILRDEEDGTFALSLVSEPAIMQDFVWLSKDGKVEIKFASVDEDKHLIVGPILIPNLKILRLKEDGTPYYVQFSPEMVKRIAQKYIKDNNANNITLEHANSVNDISLVESWVADSVQYDKARAYGLPVKVGTWFGVFKVDNQNIWDNFVKTGKVKGISLEGLFTHELIKASKINLDDELMEKEITELSDVEAAAVLSKLRNILKKDNRYRKGQKVEQYDMEGQAPSIPASTYPGEFGPGKKKKNYIHPALIGTKK
jgi:hypothetical protein